MVVSNAVEEEVVTKTWEGLLTEEFTQIIVWRMGMYEELLWPWKSLFSGMGVVLRMVTEGEAVFDAGV